MTPPLLSLRGAKRRGNLGANIGLRTRRLYLPIVTRCQAPFRAARRRTEAAISARNAWRLAKLGALTLRVAPKANRGGAKIAKLPLDIPARDCYNNRAEPVSGALDALLTSMSGRIGTR